VPRRPSRQVSGAMTTPEGARLRLRRDTIAIAVAIGVLAVVCLGWPSGDRLLARLGTPWAGWVSRVVFLLASSHLVMIVFGARRGRDLRRELVGRRSAEAELRHRADHDLLTGLFNRAAFLGRLERVVDSGDPLVIAMVDLDRFKQVNDTLGHAVGDTLLAVVAARMRECVPPDGLVARFGGDEFAFLLPGGARLQESRDCVRQLLHEMRKPFPLEGLVLEIDASVGVVISVEPSAAGHGIPVDAPSALVKQADVAMLAAKAGQLGIVEYSDHLDQQDEERLRLYGDLRLGIDAGQLCLAFQPKVRMSDGRVVGAEALVRWRHPTRGLLTPDAFLPLAEQTDLLHALTDVVLEQALQSCAQWRRQGLAVPMAVNLSARSLLDTGLVERIAALLDRYGLEPGLLELEVTETTAMANPGQAVQMLQELAALGVKVSIDDFGTGYASLAYLSRLPVKALKIDRSFVQRMTTEPTDRTIVRSTIELAHNLGLAVIAEGVEDVASWRCLQGWGCDEAQGFWISHPVPPAEITDCVRRLPGTITTMLTDTRAGVSPPR